jgi:hypothetical protein
MGSGKLIKWAAQEFWFHIRRTRSHWRVTDESSRKVIVGDDGLEDTPICGGSLSKLTFSSTLR